MQRKRSIHDGRSLRRWLFLAYHKNQVCLSSVSDQMNGVTRTKTAIMAGISQDLLRNFGISHESAGIAREGRRSANDN